MVIVKWDHAVLQMNVEKKNLISLAASSADHQRHYTLQSFNLC